MKNKPWEYSEAWDNQAQFLTWLRGQMRLIWSAYPVRTEHKDAMCVTVTPAMKATYGLHRQTKKAGQCVFCKHWFAKSKLETDHIIGNARLTQMDDVDSYLDHLLCSPTNFQLVCKPCHKVKSYAEKMDISFEAAAAEKAVIAWTKDNSIGEQQDILRLAGFEDDEMNNAKVRRESARKLLKT